MIVQCDRCGTKYNLDDAKIRPGETKVRCSRCQYVFTISHPLTLDEGEIFSETGQQTEDAFVKEWAKEFTQPSIPEPQQSAQPVSDKAPTYGAFVPSTAEEALFAEEESTKVSTTQPSSARRPPAPDKAPTPRAFVPPTAEEALFREETQAGEAAGPEEEVLPFKIHPVAAAPREKERTVSTTFFLTILLLAIVTGALYYWSKTESTIPVFTYIYERIYDFMGEGKGQKLLLYYKGSERTLEGGKVFVVQGNVTNRSQVTKKFVKLRGSLFDKLGKVVATGSGYGGITIADAEIEKSTYDSLKSSFGFPAVGQAQSLPPQQSLPFTIIFFSPPSGASQYQVDIAEAAESGQDNTTSTTPLPSRGAPE
jgi:predicted Zn finger-like uncharacterized protein